LWGRVYSPSGIACNQNANGGGAGAKTGLYIVPRGNNKGGYREVSICPSITTSSWAYNNFFRTNQNYTKFVTFFETSADSKFINNEIRRLTPREQSRVMGDVDDKFIFGDFSDSKLTQFIGNAVEIKTATNLIVKLLIDYKNTKFLEPIETVNVQIKVVEQFDLFGNAV